MKLKKRYQRWLIEILVFILVFAAARLWMMRGTASGVAPQLQGYTLEGNYFDLYKDSRRPILVYFWASWCPVCKLQQDKINAIASDYPVITIAMQSEDNAAMKKFMLEQKLSFAVINDQPGVLANRYGIRGVPAAFIIDADNNIAFAESGYTTESGLRFRLWMAGG